MNASASAPRNTGHPGSGNITRPTSAVTWIKMIQPKTPMSGPDAAYHGCSHGRSTGENFSGENLSARAVVFEIAIRHSNVRSEPTLARTPDCGAQSYASAARVPMKHPGGRHPHIFTWGP